MRLNSPARGARTVLAKAAIVLGAAAVSLAGVALPAHAADNPHIQFSNASLTKINTSGDPVNDDSRLTLDNGNDLVRFSLSWALPEGSPLATGDSFTVSMPEEIQSAQTTAGGLGKPELKVDLDNDGSPETVVGTCVVEKPRFTCTFNEKAAELVGQDSTFKNFSGNISIQLQAVAETTKEELPFSFSGKPSTMNLDLPGTGGIGAAKEKNPYAFTPAQFAKGSTAIGSSSSAINFGLGLSTSEASIHSLAYRAKQAGKPLTFDGTEKTLKFTDTIGSGLKFGDPADFKLSFTDSKATPTDAPDVPLASGDGVATKSEKGTWTFTVEPGPEGPDGQVAKLTITGPFEADANYSLTYKGLPVDGGKLKPGFKYENTFTYDDADIKANYSRSFAAAFTADVTLDPAFASFSVTKYVGGPGSSLIPQGTEFTVKATYELPSVNGVQQTVNSYPGWTAPGTVNAKKTGGEVSLVAKVGERVTFTGTSAAKALPAGTKVTLAELENPTAAPAGYLWESFTFTVKDQQVSELTLGKGEVTPVDLTNRLKKIPVGTFSVAKTVEGLTAGATAPAEYTFHYVCNDPAATTGDLKVPANGTAVTSPEIVEGAECTVTEVLTGAEVAGHRLTPAEAKKVVIKANTTVEVAAKNVYAPTTGKFTLTKKVVGDGGSALPANYTFTVACGTGTPEKVTLAADETWTSKDLAEGTSCTVTEDTAAAQAKGYTLVSDVATSPVKIVAGQTAAVVATNTYTRNLVSVGDFVWFDANRDGKQDDGELPVKDVKVTLVNSNGQTVAVTATDASGYYGFKDLAAGAAYKLILEGPDGAMWTVKDAEGNAADTKDSDVVQDAAQGNRGTIEFTAATEGRNELGAGKADDPSLDGGLVRYNLVLSKSLTTTGTVHPGDVVTFELTPRNEGPVAALAGWSVVELPPAALEVTAMSGEGYTCDIASLTCTNDAVLAAGQTAKPVTVTAKVTDGFVGTARNVASVAPVASDTLPETNVLTQPVADPADPQHLGIDTAATPTDNDAHADITTESLVSVGDRVWLDADADGQQDEGELPVAGVKVTLMDADGAVVATTVTNADGHYWFNNLRPGKEYGLKFDKIEGFTWTKQDQGDDTSDSDVDAMGAVKFTAPAKGMNKGGAKVADDPTLDAGLVKVEVPTPPAPPAPSVPPATPTEPAKPGQPVKPVNPPVKPGLPKTGR